jgi:hypothetical protein
MSFRIISTHPSLNNAQPSNVPTSKENLASLLSKSSASNQEIVDTLINNKTTNQQSNIPNTKFYNNSADGFVMRSTRVNESDVL